MTQPAISQRDLRQRSKEIMDALEGGQTFTVTRDGQAIGELKPLRAKRRFVPSAEFVAASQLLPDGPATDWSRDLDEFVDPALDDPYER